MKTKAQYRTAFPYQDDKMNLPVRELETALPFYTGIMGFEVINQSEVPVKSAILKRDDITIGLAENGGDPEQEGCFFEVDDVECAFAELKTNGLMKPNPDMQLQKNGDTTWRMFFVLAPDGLCYCLGEKVTD